MESKFFVNIIHRPELSPEYAEKAQMKVNNVQDESMDIFLFQQETAHKNGLKTTIQITYASLFSDKIVEVAKEHHEKYGDEIGLSLLGLPCKEFREKYHTEDFCIWMFSDEDKKRIVDDVFSLFYSKFGFYPTSTGSYFLDSFTINYIKEKYPMVKCAVATCWEEGPKAYHTCNNSWYTFMDGGPWNPWIPSKINSHCPAMNKEDDSGIVAIPHLSRDLLACFDGNGSNFGTHPQNVLRGMIYYKENGETYYPYLFNLIDQYRHLAKYNNGYSYNMMFVGPGWLNKMGRWESPYELLKQSYEDGMAYYGKLKKEGKLEDLTMSEFADVYRATHKDYKTGECAIWKDILYGSNKSYFWYASPYYRLCLDFNQGGACIDLRPYVARVKQEIGIGHEDVYDASYPYLIQANYRAGFFTHYAGAGTVKSCKLEYNGHKADLCLVRTMAKYEKVDCGVKVTTNEEDIELGDLLVKVQSEFLFNEKEGILEVTRKIKNPSNKPIKVTEYLTGAYGTTEYQSNMSTVSLGVDDKEMSYSYKGRKITEKGTVAYVKIPDINTRVELKADNCDMEVEEGIAFSPVYHIRASKNITEGELKTCLCLKKEN
jgi:hypothetical protein